MITIKQFIEIINSKITEAECLLINGKEFVLFSHWDYSQTGRSMEIIFDPSIDDIEFQVQVVHLHDFKNNKAYRIKQHHFNEHVQAWDGVNYIDLQTDEDMLEKMICAYNYQEYDDRISIPLDMPDDALFQLMKEAHEKDITLNEYLAEILQQQLSKMNNV
jgi:hypothetical protein